MAKGNTFLYYGKKLLLFFVSVFVLSVVVFYVSRLAPGVRAVMKCVLDGKQAAILVPTTVLARQHYLTARSRFAKIGRAHV